MATTTTHCKMGTVDSSGNVNVLYPQTTGADVLITPNSVVSATTVQNLVNSLKASAFISNFLGIDDNNTTATNKTYSVSKIRALNSDMATSIGSVSEALTKQTLYFTSVACSAMTGNFATVSDANISADHVVVECTFARPAAIKRDMTWTTTNGSLTLNGTCRVATTANITLSKKGN